jgi:hypothetical protein
MADFDLCLSSAAIKNIIIGKIQEDFEFVVGGQGYKCPRIIAEFLSPRVSLSHWLDPSIAEYVVSTPDSNDEFKLFLSLASCSTIPVSKANLDFFLSLSRELGNSDLYISLMKHFDSDFICSQLHDSTALDLFSDDLIGCISSKFSGLARSELEGIPVSVLFHILSHDLLMISSEDDLFSFITSRICSDPASLALLQFVRFEYLSPGCVSCFLSSLPESVDRRLWESISMRLIPHYQQIPCPLKQSRSIDGVISYLTQKHGGNVHDAGIVTITSKSVASDPMWALRNIADLTSVSYFISKSEPGQWVCWDFHEMRIRPTHYTIRSVHLKSWVVESSFDGVNWTEIDRKTEINDMRDQPRTASFTASFAVARSDECRFIRLTQTGNAHDSNDIRIGSYCLAICLFDVFGTLLECRE